LFYGAGTKNRTRDLLITNLSLPLFSRVDCHSGIAV
jgi:hypothetical protein